MSFFAVFCSISAKAQDTIFQITAHTNISLRECIKVKFNFVYSSAFLRYTLAYTLKCTNLPFTWVAWSLVLDDREIAIFSTSLKETVGFVWWIQSRNKHTCKHSVGIWHLQFSFLKDWESVQSQQWVEKFCKASYQLILLSTGRADTWWQEAVWKIKKD